MLTGNENIWLTQGLYILIWDRIHIINYYLPAKAEVYFVYSIPFVQLKTLVLRRQFSGAPVARSWKKLHSIDIAPNAVIIHFFILSASQNLVF